MFSIRDMIDTITAARSGLSVFLNEWLHPEKPALLILAGSVILIAGFLATRLTKKFRLPNVSGYILAGILIGPSLLDIIPESFVANMSFLSDVALALIAFEVGRSFKFRKLKTEGRASIVVTLCESTLAAILVTLALHFVFRLSLDISLVLGAVASATAPASTVMTIRQYKAKGPFVDMLLQVAAFDDAVCLLLYSIMIAFANAANSGSWDWAEFGMPLVLNVLSLVMGFAFGRVLLSLMTDKRSADNRLILSLALILALTGLCAVLKVSPLLAVMIMSATYINFGGPEVVYEQINGFTPPVMMAFFVVSGMNMQVSALKTLGVIGVAYFLIRIIGKYIGAFLGTRATGQPPEIRRNLGLALIPQAGVAIGLAMMGQRVLPAAEGHMLVNIILASSVLYEMAGPAAAKFAMRRAGVLQEPPGPPRPNHLPRLPRTKAVPAAVREASHNPDAHRKRPRSRHALPPVFGKRRLSRRSE